MIAFRDRRRFAKDARAHYRPDFAQYEQLKTQWASEHPEATHEEYQRAMRQIAVQCKI